MKALLLAGGLVCLLTVTSCSSSSKAAAKDVTITACAASPTGGHPKAAGTIVNHSSKSSAYTVHVTFKDSSGNGVGDGLAAVVKVDPGTSAKWTVTGDFNAKGPLQCKLSSVTRNVTV